MSTTEPSELAEKQVKDNGLERAVSSEPRYLGPKALAVTTLALYLAVFLVAIDRTIIATAIPRITDDFNSIQDIGWYGSAYLLTMCCFQLLFGRFYTFYSIKWVFIATIAIFELGSAICGSAPNSIAFIVGRAIAGIGAGGVFAGGIAIIIVSVPLEKRPVYQAGFGLLMGVSAIIGPLLGGALTENVSWRWCFYINLPIGAAAVAVIIPVLKTPPKKNDTSLLQKAKLLDPLGNLCFLPGVVCLLLALQWGGSTYSWSSGRIIALLTLFSVAIVAWIIIEILTPSTALVPTRIATQRSVACSFFMTICLGATMMIFVYFMPVWFQAIKGVSPIKSGVMTIPTIVPMALGAILSGKLTGQFGYYNPFMLASSALLSIGSGLITTFKPDTNHAAWIGYQVIFGFGLGLGMQQPNIAVQTVLKSKDVQMGVALILLALSLGGAIFISVGENVLTSHLVSSLTGVAGLDAHLIVNTGATDLRHVVDPKFLPVVLQAYNDALVWVFRVGLIASCLSMLGAAGVEWRNIRSADKGQGVTKDSTEQEALGGEEKKKETEV